ncbi:DMT family transporter [Laribacter hongkongensis]|uniref:DMT family transporter n=1 Tax=Laribacter hongkongensis TaxID=168471 RepID=UPI001EFE5C00|nr:DMT family transporter [Laribacter hongkongensis]MCG9107711.1 DMT family transporter [Laribacter hongkongensis]
MATAALARSYVLSTLMLPFLFIVMWSSGYVAGKVGLDYSAPYTLIFLRFASAGLIMLAVSLITRAPWPKTLRQYFHLAVVGLLVQGIQFSGLYAGMAQGVTAGTSALIVGTMPVFTALVAGWLFKERVSLKQWFGAFLGVAGVGVGVAQHGGFGSSTIAGYLFVGLALFGITVGTLYQKHFCAGLDLRTAGFVQLIAATILTAFLAGHSEGFQAQWGLPLLGSVAWLSIINSIGAVTVWFVLIQRGEAAKVSSLFHLIPGATALMGFAVLGETLSQLSIVGFAMTAVAVYLSH